MSRALKTKSWSAFLEGQMSPEESGEMATRLRQGCEDSEDFLADLPGDPVDLIHGTHDALLGDDAVLTGEQVDSALETVLARIGAAGPRKSGKHVGPWHQELPFSITSVPPPRRPRKLGTEKNRKRISMFVGAAVTACLALWLNPAADLRKRWDGNKSATTVSAGVPGVGISFAIARSGRVIRPGRTGTTVASGADLLFRFRVTGGPAYVYLVRVQGANPELVWPLKGAPIQAFDGEKDLEVDGVVQGVSMGGLDGNVHFIAIASRTPLAQPEVGPWADAGTDTVMVKIDKEAR